MDYEAWDDELEPLDDVLTPDSVDRIGPAPVKQRHHRGTARLGLSVPGAVGGVLLIGAIAFGANAGLTASTREDAASDAGATTTTIVDRAPDRGVALVDEQGNPVDEPPSGPPQEPAPTPVEPETDPTATAAPEQEPEKDPTPKPDKPKQDPTPKPDKPKPEPKTEPKPAKLGLELAIKDGAILVDWTTCEVDGADYYKVVRSTDSTVKWPTGDGDELIAAVEIGGKTKAWDKHAPSGKKAWYRVFCVRHTDDGYTVLTSSGAEGIKAPVKEEPTPKPEPSAMWIEASVDGGAVVLHWEACGADGFSHYRILRKADGDASVIAEIDDAGTTTFVDDDVEAGVEYRYLVQSKGHVGDDWYLLGTTEWVTVVVE
jgi:hypothetical protein